MVAFAKGVEAIIAKPTPKIVNTDLNLGFINFLRTVLGSWALITLEFWFAEAMKP